MECHFYKKNSYSFVIPKISFQITIPDRDRKEDNIFAYANLIKFERIKVNYQHFIKTNGMLVTKLIDNRETVMKTQIDLCFK